MGHKLQAVAKAARSISGNVRLASLSLGEHASRRSTICSRV